MFVFPHCVTGYGSEHLFTRWYISSSTSASSAVYSSEHIRFLYIGPNRVEGVYGLVHNAMARVQLKSHRNNIGVRIYLCQRYWILSIVWFSSYMGRLKKEDEGRACFEKRGKRLVCIECHR